MNKTQRIISELLSNDNQYIDRVEMANAVGCSVRLVGDVYRKLKIRKKSECEEIYKCINKYEAGELKLSDIARITGKKKITWQLHYITLVLKKE